MKENRNKSVLTNLVNMIEDAVARLFCPIGAEDISVIELHFLTSQML